MQWKIKLTRWFVYKWGKPLRQKTPPGNFKVTTPENSLLSQQVITSKGIPVSYTNLQLNLYPNIQLDLFCSDNLSFSMHGSHYVINQLIHGSKFVTNHQIEKDVGCKVFQFIHMMKITKPLGYKTLQRTNAVASWRERWTRAYVSDHNMLVKNLCIKLHSLVSIVTALKIILTHV